MNVVIINGKQFYPRVLHRTSELVICNERVVDHFDEKDFEYFKEWADEANGTPPSLDSKQGIRDIEGTFDGVSVIISRVFPVVLSMSEVVLCYSMIKRAKPPIGLMPEKIWKDSRKVEIQEAIARYEKAGLPVPKEWIDELNKLDV